MIHNDKNIVSEYFNANWKDYKDSVSRNSLYHNEMFATLDYFLKKHFSTRSFSLVDVGCGDSSAIAPSLVHTHIKKYMGIDAAGEVLDAAETTLSHIHCEKEFVCDDMSNAIVDLNEPVDIIFSSYAIHHLSYDQKVNFIKNCKTKLTENGFFLMVDIILEDRQTRERWLLALEDHFKKMDVTITASELELQMDHPRKSDFPESLSTFAAIAKKQQWREFCVLVDKGIFAFVMFAK